MVGGVLIFLVGSIEGYASLFHSPACGGVKSLIGSTGGRFFFSFGPFVWISKDGLIYPSDRQNKISSSLLCMLDKTRYH